MTSDDDVAELRDKLATLSVERTSTRSHSSVDIPPVWTTLSSDQRQTDAEDTDVEEEYVEDELEPVDKEVEVVTNVISNETAKQGAPSDINNNNNNINVKNVVYHRG